jgi:hypothetical protein
MQSTNPTCKECGTLLSGLEDPRETILRADRGELKGFCPYHDWQDLSLREQHALAEIARRKLEPLLHAASRNPDLTLCGKRGVDIPGERVFERAPSGEAGWNVDEVTCPACTDVIAQEEAKLRAMLGLKT